MGQCIRSICARDGRPRCARRRRKRRHLRRADHADVRPRRRDAAASRGRSPGDAVRHDHKVALGAACGEYCRRIPRSADRVTPAGSWAGNSWSRCPPSAQAQGQAGEERRQGRPTWPAPKRYTAGQSRHEALEQQARAAATALTELFAQGIVLDPLPSTAIARAAPRPREGAVLELAAADGAVKVVGGPRPSWCRSRAAWNPGRRAR
jgi:hypothetical protein